MCRPHFGFLLSLLGCHKPLLHALGRLFKGLVPDFHLMDGLWISQHSAVIGADAIHLLLKVLWLEILPDYNKNDMRCLYEKPKRKGLKPTAAVVQF
jgi:hypothetical protein